LHPPSGASALYNSLKEGDAEDTRRHTLNDLGGSHPHTGKPKVQVVSDEELMHIHGR